MSCAAPSNLLGSKATRRLWWGFAKVDPYGIRNLLPLVPLTKTGGSARAGRETMPPCLAASAIDRVCDRPADRVAPIAQIAQRAASKSRKPEG